MIAMDQALSRRKMLAVIAAAGTLAAIAMAAKNTSAFQRSTSLARPGSFGRVRPASLATAEIEYWQAEVGSDFDIAHTRMRLAGVRALEVAGARPPEIRQRPFIAVFELPQGEVLPGNLVYRIANRYYPEFDIFLAEPDGSSLDRMLAVFN